MISSKTSFVVKTTALVGLAIGLASCQTSEEPVLPAPESGFTRTILLGYDARPYFFWGMNRHHLIVTTDNHFLVLFNDLPPGRPETENEIVLQKLSASGERLLEKRLSFPRPSFGNGVLQLEEGGYLVVGLQHTPGNSMDSELFLIRTGGEGQPLWSKTIPGTSEEVGLLAVERPDGNFWILGKKQRDGKNFILVTDGFGNTLSRQEHIGGYPLVEILDMQPTPDGGLILAGNQIIKLDITGQLEWEHAIITEYPELGISQRCTSIAPNTSPKTQVGYLGLGHRAWNIGTSAEADGYFIFTLSHGGQQTSFNLLDLKDADEPEMIIEAPPVMDSHGFIFSGVSLNETDLRKSITVFRTTPNGEILWHKALAIYGNEAESFLANPYGLAFLPFPEPTYALSGSGFNGLGPGREVKLVIYRP